jgi:hypothetical protein
LLRNGGDPRFAPLRLTVTQCNQKAQQEVMRVTLARATAMR